MWVRAILAQASVTMAHDRHREAETMGARILQLDTLGMGDVGRVGGKNASLGEMIRGLAAAHVRVLPSGFPALTPRM
jgi:calcineurin-like phosphoesterase